MENKIVPVDGTLYTTLNCGTYAFPFQLYHDDLDHYAHQFVNWHQQKTMEISVMLEGEAEVQVLEQRIRVKEGEAFLIFPDALHTVMGGRTDHTRYFTLMFDPVLLYGYKGSFFYEKLYRPYEGGAAALYKLENRQEWEREVFEDLYWIYEHEQEEETRRQLSVYQRLQRIWLRLCENLLIQRRGSGKRKPDYELQITKMIQYLHERYQEKFSLADLANTVNVSKGECCRFFQKMIAMSPLEYLQEYRIQKCVEWLQDTDWSIMEISERAGFSTVSYFITLFKKKIGCTPGAYRQQRQEGS